MKVLFLDIDGVCNNAKTPQTDGWPIDPFMAFLVGRIVMQTDCKVVLSSAWRHSPEGRDIVAKKVTPFMDVTDDGMGTVSRGTEIKAWLDNWELGTLAKSVARPGGIYNESITAYAILDDNSDMLKEQMPHFFKTSFQTGLTEEIARDVVKHLNGYPLLTGAPDHFSAAFIPYLRDNNVVVLENDHWIVIENCKYHTPERMWLTAFAKRKDADVMHLSEFDQYEWKKKAKDKQTVERFHIHIFKPV